MINTYQLGNPWLSVSIETKEGSKFVTIHPRIHTNKSKLLPHSYGVAWKDWEILEDGDFLKYYVRFL